MDLDDFPVAAHVVFFVYLLSGLLDLDGVGPSAVLEDHTGKIPG